MVDESSGEKDVVSLESFLIDMDGEFGVIAAEGDRGLDVFDDWEDDDDDGVGGY